MSEGVSPLKALSLETKALIIVSEFEARRMPMFQMRAVLQAILKDDEERKSIVDLVEKDLRATGYPEAQVATFLSDLITVSSGPSADASITTTRRLRSPFAREFDQGPPPPPDPHFVQGGTAPGMRGVVTRPLATDPTAGAKSQVTPALGHAPIPAAPVGPRGSTNVLPAKRPTMGPGGMTLAEPTPPAGNPKLGSGPRIPVPPGAEALLPAGQKSVLRHDLAFGKVMPSTMPPAIPSATGSGAHPVTSGGLKPVVLVADDDKRIRMVFKLRLEEAGFTVLEAGDGQEAWTRIEQGGLGLLVLDMKMPGLHGLEILSRMVDRQVKLPVIVCSAYDQLENEFVVQTHPNLKYLVKPVAPDALISAARELLKRA